MDTKHKANKKSFGARLRRDFRFNKYVYLLTVPLLLYYIVFHYIPLGGIVIAFQDFRAFKGFFDSEWVGLKQFRDYFNSLYFFRTIRNTVWLNVLHILFAFPAPVVLAILINEVRSAKFKKVFQTVSYMPYFISLVVICGMTVLFTRSDGIINDIFEMFGFARTNFLANNKYYRTVYVISGIWQGTGWGTIIYLATISGVDPNLYEAASIDGAGRFRKILQITVPALVPIIIVQLIMSLGYLFSSGFEKTILLYSPQVYESSDLIASYVYRRGLLDQDFSYGAAVSLFTSLINMVFLVGANNLSRKFTGTSLW
jgi:putative aldouronate transport system permease protein